MLLSNYHYDGDVKTQPPWLAVNRSNYEKQQMIYFYLHFLFLFLYLFIYLFNGLGSNVTNPFWYDTDASYQDIFVLYSIVEPKKYQVYLLFT